MGKAIKNELTPVNEEFCVVRINGKTMVCKTHPKLEFLTVKSFKEWMANQIYWDEDSKGNKKPIALGDAWLKWPERRQYDEVVLEPEGNVPANHLNLYRGPGVTPKQGKWPLMQAHIKNILANGDLGSYGYIIRWIAWTLQNPGKCAQAALVFRGAKGSGKGTLGNALCTIFGAHHVHIIDENLLTGRFNGHLLTCLFLFADEVVWGGNKKGQGSLQGKITEPTIHIEQKGLDAIPMTNRLHILMATDKKWGVPAGEHERRYAVFNVSNYYSKNVCSDDKRKAYFGPLYHELNNGGLEAMLWDLQRAQLGDWHPREVYETEALREQQRHGMSPLQHWWEDMLHSGKLPVAGPLGRRGASTLKNNEATTQTLKEDIAKQAPKLRDLSNQELADFLNDQGAHRWKSNANRGWTFLPLAQHRVKWEQQFGPRAWDTPDAADWGAETEQKTIWNRRAAMSGVAEVADPENRAPRVTH